MPQYPNASICITRISRQNCKPASEIIVIRQRILLEFSTLPTLLLLVQTFMVSVITALKRHP